LKTVEGFAFAKLSFAKGLLVFFFVTSKKKVAQASISSCEQSKAWRI